MFKNDKCLEFYLEATAEICGAIKKIWNNRFSGEDETVSIGADGEPTTKIDQVCEEVIIEVLKKYFPSFFVISEELGKVQLSSNSNPRHFIVLDPLDATQNAVIGFPFFSTSVSFYMNNEINFSFVYIPTLNTLYYAQKNNGAWEKKEGKLRKLNVNDNLTLTESVLGIIRPKDNNSYKLLEEVFLFSKKIRLVSCSSIELCFIASGIYDAFVDFSKPGWQKLCDIDAALLILSEAGGVYSLSNEILPLSIDEIDLKQKTSIVAACTTDLLKDINQTLWRDL